MTLVRPVWRAKGGIIEISCPMRVVCGPVVCEPNRAILNCLPDGWFAWHDSRGRSDPLKLATTIGPNRGANGRIRMHRPVVDNLGDRQMLTFRLAARFVVHG
jgi:hypothetical protein